MTRLINKSPSNNIDKYTVIVGAIYLTCNNTLIKFMDFPLTLERGVAR